MREAYAATASRSAGPREWAGLSLLMFPCVIISVDTQVLNLAAPRLSADLRPSSSELLWILDSYMLVLAGLLLTMGSLGDRIGRRRLMLGGATVFGCASLFAAYASTAGMLIVARAALGIAAAAMTPSTLSLIRTMFVDRRQRTAALGVWTASFSLGGIIAPPLGGLLLGAFWWGSVFLVAVPAMMLLLVLGPWLLPEFRDQAAPRPHLVTAVLSFSAVLAFGYGIKRVPEEGWRPLPIAVTVLGIGLGTLFVVYQRRRPRSGVDLGLFRQTTFSAPLAANGLAFFVLYAFQVAEAQYLQVVVGLSPLRAAFLLIPPALGYLLGSALGPLAARRIRPGLLMCLGLVLATAGFLLVTQVGAGGLAILVAGTITFSIGLAPVYIVATELAIASAPAERAGGASATAETTAILGGALGIAVLGSYGISVYRRLMGGAETLGVPAVAVKSARDTPGGAIAVAAQVPEHAGDQLLELARDAFTTAFISIAGVGAAILAVTAVGAAILLRSVPNPSPLPDEDPEATAADTADGA